MKAITHSFRWPGLMMRLALCVAMLALILAPTAAVAQVPVNGAGGPAPPEASPFAVARPLAELLNPDGTLNLATGFRGSVDARGWQLVSGPGEGPRFAPLAASGDENWADHFGPPGTDNPVFALAVDGGDLYVGGMFTTAGGVSANYIARWNGSSWSALGSGMDYWVRALAVDGSGNLYAGGDFTQAGGVTVNYVALWDGSSWSALGGGMDGDVLALVVDGENLYVGGQFTTAGGKPSARIARWSWPRLYLPLILRNFR